MAMQDLFTPVGRLSFPALFKPTKFDADSAEKFETTFILEKAKNAAFIATLKEAVRECAQEQWGNKIPPTLHLPIRDGAERPDKDGFGEHVWFFRASSKSRVPILDQTGSAVLVPDDVYPGMHARLRFRPFAYDHKVKKGISFGLRAVQVILGSGEPLGGAVTADTAFKDAEPMEGMSAGMGPDDDPFA